MRSQSRFEKVFAVFLCLVPLIQIGASMTQQTARFAIEGVVLDARNEPVGGADVQITTALPDLYPPSFSFTGAVSRSLKTNSSGRFSFSDVPSGSYRILVRATGFASQEYGQKRPNSSGMRISLHADREAPKDIVIRLAPLAVVSGRLLNEAQEPIVNFPVRLLKPALTGGFSTAGSATTDDRGMYRIFTIPAGRYYLAAGDNAPRMTTATASVAYTLQFFPGVSDVTQAIPLDVTSGAEMRFDMTVRHFPTYRIQGEVTDAVTGKPPRDIVRLSLDATEVVLGTTGSTINNIGSVDSVSGRFELALPAGSYVIQAQTRVVDEIARLGGEAAWSMFPTARTAFTVRDSEIDNLRLTLKRPEIVPGRVRVEGGTLPSQKLQIALAPTSSRLVAWDAPLPEVSADGAVRFLGIIDGSYLLLPQSVPKGFRIKSIQYGGEDILNQPWRFSNPSSGTVEIVLAAETAEVTGTVKNARSESTLAQAVLVPDVRSRTDLFRASPVGEDGRFKFSDVAFGNYKLFVWEDMESLAFFDPNFLKRFDGLGTPVNILDRSSRSFDVLAIPVP